MSKFSNIIFVLSVMLTSGCSSFKESHVCKNKVAFAQGEYKYCKDRDTNLWGLYEYQNNREVVPSKYINIMAPSTESNIVWFKDKGDEYFTELNLLTKEESKTKYKYIINPPIFLNKNGALTVAIDDKNVAYTFDKKGAVAAKLHHLDTQGHKNDYGHFLNRLTLAWFGDVIIGRFHQDGKSYYQHFDTNGKMIGERYPLDKVEFILVDGYYFLMEKLGDRLYWPILYNNTTKKFMEKPEHIKGLALHFQFEWHEKKGFHDVRNESFKIPSVEDFMIVFEQDKKIKLRKKYVKMSSLKKWGDYFHKFANIDEYKIRNRSKPEDYTNLRWYSRQDVNKDGVIINVTTPYFQSERSGQWRFMNMEGDLVTSNEYSFKSEKELLEFFDSRTKNVAQLSKEKVMERQQDLADYNKAQRELKAADDAEKAKLYAEKAARKNYDRQRVKAESDAAWGRVSDQIQGAATRASKKAKCISKQTATKKAFLDKKQGWYETGGCK